MSKIKSLIQFGSGKKKKSFCKMNKLPFFLPSDSLCVSKF